MKKETPFLDLHYELLESNFTDGLCGEYFDGDDLVYNKTFELLVPTEDEKSEYGVGLWWGTDYGKGYACDDYGPTRQNIVLLCAAINGEL